MLTTLAEKLRDRKNRAPVYLRDAPDAAWYLAFSVAVEANLHDHILGMWFPRTANFERGGFDENFSQTWTQNSGDERSLVYQARLTWLASQAALHHPSQCEYWLGFARHGIEFLETALWDRTEGGFFWQLNSSGAPVHSGEKHVYGHAFAIYALSAYYRLTREPRALQLAHDTLHWLDSHALDTRNGGYFEALSREGRPLLASPGIGRPHDFIGTRFGFKSANAHLHLLEAYSSLLIASDDARVSSRLRELFSLLRATIILPTGTIPEFFTLDWSAVPGPSSFGHDIEAAFLLLDAATALGSPHDEAIWAQARQLVDHTLEFGWDTRYGGCFDSGEASGRVCNDQKIWWVQGEACHSFLIMHEKYGEQTLRYWEAFVAQWEFINAHQTDHKNGGWRRVVARSGKALRGQPKSNGWTEGYHQGRALMNISSRLQRLARDADSSPAIDNEQNPTPGCAGRL